jgi:hypothetical protein
MTPQEILNKCADDFEANPKSWTQCVFIADEHGRAITYESNLPLIERSKRPEAKCFCAVGKIYQVAETEAEALKAVNLFGKMLKKKYFSTRDWFGPQDCVVSYNDALDGPEFLIANIREVTKRK